MSQWDRCIGLTCERFQGYEAAFGRNRWDEIRFRLARRHDIRKSLEFSKVELPKLIAFQRSAKVDDNGETNERCLLQIGDRDRADGRSGS
jgi:hypothetical protein